MPPDPIPLHEALLCLSTHQGRVVGTLVRRDGLRLSLLLTLRDDQAALASSPPGLELLSDACDLPVRTLDGDAGHLLALRTLLANRENRDFVLSREEKLP